MINGTQATCLALSTLLFGGAVGFIAAPDAVVAPRGLQTVACEVGTGIAARAARNWLEGEPQEVQP